MQKLQREEMNLLKEIMAVSVQDSQQEGLCAYAYMPVLQLQLAAAHQCCEGQQKGICKGPAPGPQPRQPVGGCVSYLLP